MTNSNEPITIHQSIRNSAIGLAIFAFFTAGIISVTQLLTKNTISQNQQAFEARLLLSLLPSSYDANQILQNGSRFDQLGLQPAELLHVDASETLYQLPDEQGNIAVILLPVIAPEGYTEAIRLIVGIDAYNGSILGVRVTQHKETPGLGDQIEITKSDWVLSFNGKSLLAPEANHWAVKKDGGQFDQLTGATITPRAIVKAVQQALAFFAQNQAVLTNQ